MATPEKGERWQHYKGGEYEIDHLAKDAEEDPPSVVVVYHGVDGVIWARHLTSWFEMVTTPEGIFHMPRFKRTHNSKGEPVT